MQVNFAYRWFCGLSIEDKIPDHSAFSRARNDRFRESDIFRSVFERVVGACLGAGLVGGEGFAVDASLIVADANKQRSIPGPEWSKELDAQEASRAAKEYLADIRETDPIYAKEGLGHPGLLQRVMNRALVDNAILGPWIHVGSKMQLLSAAKAGDVITARAKVTGNYDKKGHRFVELDALVVANGKTPLAHCHHIAIYQPREQAAA